MEQLPRLYLTREDMMKRIARFKDLKGSDGGLPDSKMPGCERTLVQRHRLPAAAGCGRERDLSGRRPCCAHGRDQNP